MDRDKEEKFYRFIVTLNLEYDGFKDLDIKTKFNGRIAVMESTGFEESQPCVDACNKLFVSLTKMLGSAAQLPHVIAYEVNPKVQPSSPHLTPQDQWIPGELAKMYITNNDSGQLTLKNLNPIVKASILVGNKIDVDSN